MWCVVLCLFKQKTAYEMRISDWSSDVCSSDLFSLAIAAFWGIIAYKAGLRAYDAYVLNQRPIGAVGIPLAVSYGVVCLGSAVGAVASLGPILRLRRPADPASTTGQQVSR